MIIFLFNSLKLLGKKANNILEPSKGGIGIKLKTPKIKLIIIKLLKINGIKI